MAKTNKEIFQGFADQVINEKRTDLWDKYVSTDFRWRTSPYVGMGITTDDSSGDKLIIASIAPGSPAEGKLQPGDEIIRAEDENSQWETFKQLKNAVWGLGQIGSTVKVRVRRGEESIDYELTKGLIEGFDIPNEINRKGFQTFLLKEYPDVKVTVKHILEEGDMIACYLEYKGTNSDFHREAIWTSCMFFRLSDGKIVEGWGIDDDVSVLKQLGYEIKAPSA